MSRRDVHLNTGRMELPMKYALETSKMRGRCKRCLRCTVIVSWDPFFNGWNSISPGGFRPLPPMVWLGWVTWALYHALPIKEYKLASMQYLGTEVMPRSEFHPITACSNSPVTSLYTYEIGISSGWKLARVPKKGLYLGIRAEEDKLGTSSWIHKLFGHVPYSTDSKWTVQHVQSDSVVSSRLCSF